MDRQREFRELQRNLGLSAPEVATLIGKSVSTVNQYRSDGKHRRIPPDDVLATMRAAWRVKARENLDRAIATIRALGLDIDWWSLLAREEETAGVGDTFRRPGFLGSGLLRPAGMRHCAREVASAGCGS
jgi:transcriptional regulator with XRE-family HTH domain